MTEPRTMTEALDMIDDLRARLAAATDPGVPPPHGLTRKEAEIYGVLRRRRFARRDALYTVVYGLADAAPESRVMDVMICNLRKKLPPGERIVTVWGQGFRLEGAA